MNKEKKAFSLSTLTGIGIFAALAAVVSFATSFLKVDFLSLDAGDIVIVLASFIYGAPAGVAISAVASGVGFLYSGTGPWGLVMDFCSSATFAFVAAFIYSKRRDFKSAVIGIFSAVVATTAIMIPLNIFITPLYTGAPREVVIAMILPLLLPFNFVKTLFNGSAALLIYKPVVRAMRAARLAPPSHTKEENAVPSSAKKTTKMALILGGAALLVAIGGLIALSVIYGFNVEIPW
ncbi:MAG: ECF transporter S component [Clostridia bacterium]|nr:ECF transporter S component [Clostridia bacterium]